MQPLFRPEAIAHATGRLDGAVLLPAPLATWATIGIVVAVLGLGAWFAATATYTRHESVRGWLSPQGGVSRAVAGQHGTVTALLVSEADMVQAGTPLARIGPPAQPDAIGDDVVSAPIGGRIDALAAHLGQTVRPGDTVAVVTADDELIAELLVPPHAAGLVVTGQTLPLKYDALPLGRRGVQDGTVTYVSRTALAPDEVGNPGIPVGRPVFRVRVRLPAQHVDAGGTSVQLRAGMLLTAEIAGHRRTLIGSLWGPDGAAP